ncbi:MAG: leucine-rich repeat protein [Bacilli bacterium]|nr:leucine-rich repeat protein [Bacilli bacterium]
MNKKTKTLILSIVVTLILLLTFTVTYAAFVYRQTGEDNHQLVLGDIYMHYNETNQLKMEYAMPSTGVKKISFYTPNPVMQTEESGTGVLGKCENLLESTTFDEGTTATTFCQGNGTMNGYDINFLGHMFIQMQDTRLLEDEIFLKKDIYSAEIVLNPAMQTDESGTGVLGKCENFSESIIFDEGTTATTFCQGTGTSDGKTLFEAANEDDIMLSLFLSYEFLVSKTDLSYFEFTISGKNTYKQKDIWYDVVLNHGDVPEGKLEENRINDEFLRFALFEVNGENQKNIFNNRSYSSLENKRIHVETIPKNTTEEINKTYRLYMWIDDSVVIGNVNEDYTMEEWKDVFASIKVSVTGEFNEKELQLEYEHKYDVTEESCFTTGTQITFYHNNNMTTSQLQTCVEIMNETEIVAAKLEGETVESFCEGKGTIYGYTFQDLLDIGFFTDDQLQNLGENEIVSAAETIYISGYAKTCGSDVVIPKTINNKNVTLIEERAFSNKELTSVVIPNTVINLERLSFANNKLTSVIFEENSSLKEIRIYAFTGDIQQITEVTIPNTVIYLDCNAFNSDVIIHKNENLVCFSEHD